MELFLVRHAWAGHFGDPEWPDDSLRPLDAAGRKRFGRMAAKLARGGLAPTLIAASPMARCLQTAEILAAKIGVAAEVVVHDELLSGGNLDNLLAWTAEQAARHAQIAWVGHEPDASNHAAALLGCRGGDAFPQGGGLRDSLRRLPAAHRRPIALAGDGEDVELLKVEKRSSSGGRGKASAVQTARRLRFREANAISARIGKSTPNPAQSPRPSASESARGR